MWRDHWQWYFVENAKMIHIMDHIIIFCHWVLFFSENCLTGDYRSPFPLNTGGPPITCSEMAAQQPWLCYSEHNANLCCGSCGEIYNPQLQGLCSYVGDSCILYGNDVMY